MVGRSPASRAAATILPVPALLLLAACRTGNLTIGRPTGPEEARTLVTAGGVRAPVDAGRIDEIYRLVLGQFETISCTRTVSVRQPTRSRAPRPSGAGIGTTADRWTQWFEGHEHESSRTRYCTFAASLLNVGGPLMTGPGRQDSTIHVVPVQQGRATYPWESLVIQGDTARIATHLPVHVAYSVYAFLHLLREQGRLDRWMPETSGADDYAVERAILERTADAWLLMRGGYAADPDPLLDELVMAREADLLDAFVFTRRPDAFVERRQAWLGRFPDGPRDYLTWHDRAFDLARRRGPD